MLYMETAGHLTPDGHLPSAVTYSSRDEVARVDVDKSIAGRALHQATHNSRSCSSRREAAYSMCSTRRDVGATALDETCTSRGRMETVR